MDSRVLEIIKEIKQIYSQLPVTIEREKVLFSLKKSHRMNEARIKSGVQFEPEFKKTESDNQRAISKKYNAYVQAHPFEFNEFQIWLKLVEAVTLTNTEDKDERTVSVSGMYKPQITLTQVEEAVKKAYGQSSALYKLSKGENTPHTDLKALINKISEFKKQNPEIEMKDLSPTATPTKKG